MGILSRFKEMMSSNVHAILERADDPGKTLDACMRSLSVDLGAVRAETASVIATESRAKRALDECKSEIRKLHRYAERSVQDGREEEALEFLEMKAAEAQREGALQDAYDEASANTGRMKQLQDKLTADIGELEARRARLKGKLAAAEAQQKINELNSSYSVDGTLLDAMEEKADRAYNEAMALAELRREAKGNSDLDEQFKQYDRGRAAEPEDELADLKAKLNKKESHGRDQAGE
ncbi:PspA/IM30 family protein [Paenibacillus sp. J5C_2022]|uniref:PspA/IM30 family protein n=1 Tax=Paenibacillus sp. J5C2022 TaxID=2977129 RepID=UPI0021D2F20D|nr:PspA/IM30 family protein [Paenibacillus sp. J5C2022]MCU6708713.1 PspA/IM30 family protein [Paenibacillus sp. J5C2022]